MSQRAIGNPCCMSRAQPALALCVKYYVHIIMPLCICITKQLCICKKKSSISGTQYMCTCMRIVWCSINSSQHVVQVPQGTSPLYYQLRGVLVPIASIVQKTHACCCILGQLEKFPPVFNVFLKRLISFSISLPPYLCNVYFVFPRFPSDMYTKDGHRFPAFPLPLNLVPPVLCTQ